MKARAKETPAWRWVLGGGLVIAILVPLGATFGVVVPRRARHAALLARLEERVADFHARGWERPVLRGAPIDHDAQDAQRAAIERLAPHLPEAAFEDVTAPLRAGMGPSRAIQALLADHRDDLDAYRASAQCDHAWGAFPIEQGMTAATPPYAPHIHASRLLLLRGEASGADECLRASADVIRLAQDRAAGMSLVALMVHHLNVRDAFAVMGRCLPRASHPARREAGRELAILARHPTPAGACFEAESLLLAVSFHQQLEATPLLPIGPSYRSWLDVSDVLEAWDLVMNEADARRRLGERYPEDLETLAAMQRATAASSNPILATGAPDLVRYLRRDAEARAAIRMLWAAARLLVELDAAPSEVPRLLDDPELSDPLTGRPFEAALGDGWIELRSDGAEADDGLVLRLDADAWSAPTPP